MPISCAKHPLRPLAFGLASAIALTSCGGDSTGPQAVATVTISPTSPSVVIGTTQQFTATTKDANGATLTGRTVTWSSSSTSTATISTSGLATTLVVGTSTVTATSEGKTATTTLTVLPIPVATVTVTPATPTVIAGQTVQLTAVTKDASGNTLTGRTVTWSSSSSSATVSTSGLVTGSSAGTATITATSEGKTATSTVTVTAQTVSYEYYKRGGTATPATATLTLLGGTGQPGTLSIDGQSITVNVQADASGINCFVGSASSAITTCANNGGPLTIRLCGPSGGVGSASVLLYVLFPSTDANRVSNSSTALLAAVQSYTGYLGIGVFPGCGGTLSTSWIRNAPNTNYYLWPNVSTFYTPAYVSGLLSGAVIYSTPTPGNDYNKFVAVRVSATVFEVWH